MSQFIRCPQCGGKNYDTAVKCDKCGSSFKADANALALERIVIATTPALEGFRIAAYLGIVTSNVVLGSDWSADWNTISADFAGSRATGMQNRLQLAALAAQNELRALALARGGDAVVGVDLDYQIFGSNMVLLCANGTVVTLAPG